MSQHRMQLSSDGTKHTVVLNGIDLSRGLQGISLELLPGQPARVVLDPLVIELDEVGLDKPSVYVSDHAAKLLTALGWTPPSTHDSHPA